MHGFNEQPKIPQPTEETLKLEGGDASIELSLDAQQLIDIPDLKTFVEKGVAENIREIIDFIREVNEFVGLCKSGHIDGTFSADERETLGSPTCNAIALAVKIEMMSTHLYTALYNNETSATSRVSEQNISFLPIDFRERCQEYIEKNEIKNMSLESVMTDDRFDTHSMKALPGGSESRRFVKKPHSWVVRYAGHVLKHADVETM
ncbi:MAG: hypothetical protein COV91_04670 [Candidatus Taylorbacteria bacterium CG11_big_fil_rev_8_21_14_0_20_46_11]|uniref:Uncharacterized protein n=1 Tax=Candidatus Taylorbacteria bacterium CG11_big_fil_rev_8_21_14_0_20_46_11 TaxID=1975025 RepID=A0A2H0KCP1_9BACT|nr:MAG: hypothetical protein COV91_04670 [Candidatus Taylorbacteria bacterium CG11_big_fil_rev_8_21_14_0_20_46_11]